MERCDLLNRYDVNSDGTMDKSEALTAVTDRMAGTISSDEFDSIYGAWEGGEGAVTQLCPPTPCGGTIIIAAVVALVILFALVG